ncbi:MAG TPA: fibronectin type III domain-containing protein, partial [Candidatus Eisenbacteria bacterium]|nr:fibronectin type III domain-containing protein [Candidatus Eisenbacteria bacterium]
MQARRAAAAMAILGLAAALAAGSCFAVTLTRYPSVWLRTKDAVTIAWQTDVPSSGTVLFGPTPALGASRSHAGTVVDHAVLVDGLDPGSTYYYRVVSDADT